MGAIPRLIATLVCTVAVGLALSLIVPATHAQSDQPIVVVAKMDGPITPVMARYINRAISRAEDRSASALVIEMNTPGGLSSAMDDIIDDILQSKVPVIVYVSPANARAASAGVYITYASHVAVMAPSTNIGSASPVMTGSTGNAESDATMKKKVTNDAVARITNLAQLRGRNVEWAVSAVEDAANITSQQALDMHVIDMIEPNLDQLLADVNGRTVNLASGPVTLNTANAQIQTVDMGWLEQFLQMLADSTLAYLLVSFGMLGIFIELSHPGISFPGIFGGIALLLGLLGLGSLPVAWGGLAFMALGFVLFVIDIFVASAGLLTIGGLISFLIGSNILISNGAPSDQQIPNYVTWTMTACLAGAALLLGMVVAKSQLRRPKTGKPGMIGQIGVTRTALDPSGMVLVFGELWAATAEQPPIAPGQNVSVTAVNGMSLLVRRATAEEVIAFSDVADRRAVVPVQ
ncbi:MAG TPA: nodulation protein NfeD [Thermomicrobiales bacterium]|nr:nodulation protein NfeD [Thermomicrobiales bacterium]